MTRTAGLPSAVLFACTMNAVRSPMAAAILRHLAGNRVYIASAGVREGEHDPFVDAVMEEIAIDVSRHMPQVIADLNDTSFDLIVTCHRKPITRRLSSRARWRLMLSTGRRSTPR